MGKALNVSGVTGVPPGGNAALRSSIISCNQRPIRSVLELKTSSIQVLSSSGLSSGATSASTS